MFKSTDSISRLCMLSATLIFIVTATSSPVFASCVDDADCNDGVACTLDQCNAGICENFPSDQYCIDADGLFCDGLETCDPVLGCQTGPDPCPIGLCDENADACGCFNDFDCDDGVPCTIDTCDTQGYPTCVNQPNDTVCDDGLFCNGAEICDPVFGCQPGVDPCDDQVACTDDCDEETDACTNTPNDANCNDTIDCTVDTCDPQNGCQFTPDDSQCDDHVGCTDDFCSILFGCLFTRNDSICDDGLFCNGAEICDSVLGCQPGVDPCDDQVACTDDCDEETDACTNTPNDANCNDTIDCTVDTCDPQNGCQFTPDDSQCDDYVGCTDDFCSILFGCLFTRNDSNCDDGVFCNGDEVCDVILDCQPGDPDRCNDGFECTTDSCNENVDICLHDPDHAGCDDGLYCNGVETCSVLAGCQPGSFPCYDGVLCTDDVCDDQTDSCSYPPNDAACDDGLFCNGAETCDPVLDCQTGDDPCDDQSACTADSCDDDTDTCTNQNLCDDGIACTVDTCDPQNGCQFTPDDSRCDDGVDCTDDFCSILFGCLFTRNDSNCDDEIACTLDQCNPSLGGCNYIPVDSACDDGQFCDGEETCTLSGCQDGPDPCPAGCDEFTDTCTQCNVDSDCAPFQKCCNGVCKLSCGGPGGSE